MRASSSLFATTAVCILARWRNAVDAHPLCYYDDKPTDPDMVLTFCPEQEEGACCNDLEEAAAIAVYEAELPLSDACAELYKQVACGPCNAYAAHLYENLGAELGPEDGMTMKEEFCEELTSACDGEITFKTYDGDSYCEKHVGSGIWAYPIDEEETTFSAEGLVEAFSNLDDAELPDQLICMHMTPDGEKWFLGGQHGEIKEMSSDDPTSASTVVTIGSDQDFYEAYEEGLLDFAFSPAFDSNNFFYVSYTIDNDDGRQNRISRFTYVAGSPTETLASIEVILTTEAKSTSIHSAGWIGFKPSDYDSPGSSTHDLYWATGDGGPQTDTLGTGQDTDNLLAAIVRISVPSSSSGTGYTIPSGNYPGGREEICAPGFRNPFRCGFDKGTDNLYCGDVGHTLVEEIDLVECGKNYGWSVFEGSRCQEARFDADACAAFDRSDFEFPIFEYCHPGYDDEADGEDAFTGGVDICGTGGVSGNAVIGGHVYRGERFSEVLTGALLFADSQKKNIYYLQNDGGEWMPGTIISDNSASIISFSEDLNGEIYVISSGRSVYQLPCGDLCSSTCLEQSEIQPTYTSLACVQDVTTDRALQLQQAPDCADSENAMSPSVCASYCQTISGAEYFGVQYAYECFCGAAGEDYDRHGVLDMDQCSYICTGTPTEFCGGYSTMEVYSFEAGAPTPVPPTPTPPTPTPSPETTDGYSYVGCYEDASARIFSSGPFTSSEMTAEECSGLCTGSDYFGTQYGEECFCSVAGDDYETYGTATCSTACTGDATETCGGSYAMSVYEFEDVVTPTPTPSDDYTYVNCFADSKTSRVLTGGTSNSNTNTAEECSETCTGFAYFGTEYSLECFCGDSIAGAVTSTACDYSCTGDASETCGGNNAISIYEYGDAATDAYLGCFVDSKSARVMGSIDFNDDAMTTELCADFCAGSTYYATQYGTECFCSDADGYDALGSSTNACDYPCPGDASQICGGFDALSVYQS